MHIDWSTLALQTVNVLILIWILGRFFFRPVADLVTKRKEAAAKLLADADVARKDAEQLRAEATGLRADINAERGRLLNEARKAADAEKATQLAQLSDELDKRRKDATAAIDKERAAMARDVLDHASTLSIDIARRLLERLPAGVAFSAFLDGVRRELGKLPAEARDGLATMDQDHPIEVVAATPLSDEQAEELREMLRAALGVGLPMKLSCDRTLIAGFEVRGRNLVLRNNWQADLMQIQKELDR